jgi:RNA polymerase sigma-70 factor (ECF subfamily)
VDELKAGNLADDEGELEEEEIPFTVDQVKSAMIKLSDGYRIVFSLYLFEDYSHKQIAEELGITESTSKSQLNRAKKRLMELLNEMKN